MNDFGLAASANLRLHAELPLVPLASSAHFGDHAPKIEQSIGDFMREPLLLLFVEHAVFARSGDGAS